MNRVWYLETSAFVKLVTLESHSAELIRWLERELSGDGAWSRPTC